MKTLSIVSSVFVLIININCIFGDVTKNAVNIPPAVVFLRNRKNINMAVNASKKEMIYKFIVPKNTIYYVQGIRFSVSYKRNIKEKIPCLISLNNEKFFGKKLKNGIEYKLIINNKKELNVLVKKLNDFTNIYNCNLKNEMYKDGIYYINFEIPSNGKTQMKSGDYLIIKLKDDLTFLRLFTCSITFLKESLDKDLLYFNQASKLINTLQKMIAKEYKTKEEFLNFKINFFDKTTAIFTSLITLFITIIVTFGFNKMKVFKRFYKRRMGRK